MKPNSGFQRDLPTLARIAIALFRRLASLKLAVLLLVVLAGVLSVATFLDAARGPDYAQWYVYHAWWFAALLALLAANILAATLIRFPWGYRRIGFLIAHAGLLVLLAGSIQSFMGGVSGQLSLVEGETAREFLVTDRSQFMVQWQGQGGATGRPPVAFAFRPGPVDWPEGKTLDFGELGGVGLKVLKFYAHAGVAERWVEDERGLGNPALRLALAGPDGQTVRELWLGCGPSGAEASLGPVRLELHRAPVDSMLEDFLKPPTLADQKQGVLSVHHEGRVERIGVSEHLGKKVPVGKSKIAVEIVRYLPNGKIGGAGRSASEGTDPANPMLELRVQLPGQEKPVRQFAFARYPLFGADGVHGRSCPVRFWYHHPAVRGEPGVEFLQTSDGKLHSRAVGEGKNNEGKSVLRGEVGRGDRIEVSQDSSLSIVDYLPHARRETSFQPLEFAAGQAAGAEPAALVEISTEEGTEQIWLKRNDPKHGFRTVPTPQEPLAASFRFERVPLDFSLTLLRFQRGLNPGGAGDASFASTVRLADRAREVDQEHEIAMNQPLAHGKYRFYQASFDEPPDGRKRSVLAVACDPGRSLKYAGSLMLCAGILAMISVRFRRAKSGASQTATPVGGANGRPERTPGRPVEILAGH